MDTIFFLVAKLVGLLIRFETVLFLLLILSLGFYRLGWRRTGNRGLWLAFTLTLAIAILPLGTLLLHPLETRFPANPPLTKVDGFILLGGAEEPGLSRHWDQPVLNGSGERYVVAAMLARAHPAARVIFTGGSGRVFQRGGKEVSVAENILLGLGLAADRLILEDTARNTAENARASFDLAQPKPGEIWVLVTSASHMPRAFGSFCKAGWQVTPYPVDYRSGTFADSIGWDFANHLTLLNKAIKEWVGLLAYYAAGRTGALLPEGC